MKARDKLIEHNLRLVVFLAKKYENTKIDLEDLVSIGTIGLIKGVNTYQNDKNIKLATYASRCIDNEILMYLRKTKKKRTEVSFEDSLSYDSEGNELHLEDVLGTKEDIVTKPIEDELDKYLMYKEVDKLGKRDKEIIELRYGLNGKKEMTQKEVAELLGISQSYISRIEKKVIKRLSTISSCSITFRALSISLLTNASMLFTSITIVSFDICWICSSFLIYFWLDSSIVISEISVA